MGYRHLRCYFWIDWRIPLLRIFQCNQFNSPEKAGLMEEEERERGSVSLRVYLEYMKAYSPILFLVVVILKVVEDISLVGQF